MRNRWGPTVVTAFLACGLACGEGLPERADAPDLPRGNLLLVSVDTLRADHLGCYGSELGLTPRVDALAAESTRFARAYSPAPFTLPAVGALMTGRYPEALGLRHNLSRVPVGTETLASHLQARGYSTSAVVSNPVLAPRARLDHGFARYDAEFPEREKSRGAAERSAGATTDAALASLDEFAAGSGAPFFLWVHYQDPHGPYTPPAGLRESYLSAARAAKDGRRLLRPLEGWRGEGGIPAYQYIAPQREAAWYRAGYAGEVRHVDEEFGRLIDGLRARGLLEETVVVLTADHGEALGEQDYWFAHGEHLDDPAVRVPLLVRIPGGEAGVSDELVSLVDVAPTVSALLGAPFDARRGGVDLFAAEPPDPKRAVYASTNESAASRARRAIVADGFKLVREHSAGGVGEKLFRLPNERLDVAAREPARARALSRRLDTLIPKLDRHPALAPDPTDDEIERLRALGYVFEENE